MTVRFRLLTVTLIGLAVTMAIWGWIQLKALEKILVEQQIKRLYDVAETANTYYQHFPTRQGLSALDATLKELVQTDGRLARIDIFSIEKDDADAWFDKFQRAMEKFRRMNGPGPDPLHLF